MNYKSSILDNENPEYWDVQFYEPRTQNEAYSVNTITENLEEKFHQVEDTSGENYFEFYTKKENAVMKSKFHDDYDDDDDYGGNEEDNDDFRDEDYQFEETDEEEDLKYEYLKSKRNKMQKKSNTKSKENKSKQTNVNTENNTLEELIVKKNKNYVKRDKRKSYKNVWSRRLRQKLDA